MPIYEYDCPKCGRFDVIQKMSSRPLKTHDACGSRVEKAVSAGSFTVKGPGASRSAPSCERASPSSPACASCPSARG
jgi:putative FmdB family regulatory protein